LVWTVRKKTKILKDAKRFMSKNFQPNIRLPNGVVVKRRKSPIMVVNKLRAILATDVADLIAGLSIKHLMENLLLMSLIVGQLYTLLTQTHSPSNWH
jgi:hypothetical protein